MSREMTRDDALEWAVLRAVVAAGRGTRYIRARIAKLERGGK